MLNPTARPQGQTYVRWKILALLFALPFVAYILRLNLSVVG